MKYRLLVALMIFCLNVIAQKSDSIPAKGSYLFYGQPAIEDNSMFIEEAFNQDAGVIQHIANFIFNGKEYAFAYTQEIPLADVKHQFSFGISYVSQKKPEGLTPVGSNQFLANGLGDVVLNYRPLLLGKDKWALIIPRFTLIVPTGNARYGLGAGGWGGQFNMAVTKRSNRRLITHYNAGYTVISKADYFSYAADGTAVKTFEKNLGSANLGGSMIWLLKPKFNLMVEYLTTFGHQIQDDGSITKDNATIINLGFRFALEVGKIQVVPGLGMPLNFSNGNFDNRGGFIYLSIEPAY